jgi:hypothetical protein
MDRRLPQQWDLVYCLGVLRERRSAEIQGKDREDSRVPLQGTYSRNPLSACLATFLKKNSDRGQFIEKVDNEKKDSSQRSKAG